jgi:hypothetical protein
LRTALADFASLGVEADEEFVGQGNTDHLGRFAGGAEALLEGNKVGLVAAYDAGYDEQDFAHRAATSTHTALALMLARVRSQGRYSGQF